MSLKLAGAEAWSVTVLGGPRIPSNAPCEAGEPHFERGDVVLIDIAATSDASGRTSAAVAVSVAASRGRQNLGKCSPRRRLSG